MSMTHVALYNIKYLYTQLSYVNYFQWKMFSSRFRQLLWIILKYMY